MTLSPSVVKPADIQAALNRIWESLKTTTTTRACLFNLIFYTEKNHRTPYIQRIAQNVVQKFPARVIFVTVDKEGEGNELKTSVSILPSSKGENDVACDFIHMEATHTSQELVPFVVLPHLLSDLPIYLVWAEDPSFDDTLFQQLAKLSSRLIFDSESAKSLSLFATSLLNHAQALHTDVADLNWARIETWRDMLSSAFYSSERFSELEAVQSIQITYNAQETPFFCHTEIQAFYCQAWLACQLKWKFIALSRTQGRVSISYQKQNAPVDVQLIPTSHPHLPPGLILSMDLKTADGSHFLFQRNLQSIYEVALIFSNQDRCDIPCNYIFAKAESGHSLVKEICHRGTSKHFLSVLNLLTQVSHP